MSRSPDARRGLPSVDALLGEPRLVALVETHGRTVVRDALRAELAQHRQSAAGPAAPPGRDEIVAACAERIAAARRPALARVINLTGTVIHSNLGRAPLPRCAIEAVAQAMAGPVTLEFDLADGVRGERDRCVEERLVRLTGAEAALVVNNNAAAVYLALNALAEGREVVVSRGELVEIGGGFRVPDIMRRAGVRLVETGTTNRTHPRDYAEAIGPDTAALMKVHASNYRIEGFTASVSEAGLAPLARAHGLALLTDLGSGALVDLRRFGLPHEPTVRETLAHGADLVTFSGDKLLGGPQAGLIAGRADLVERLRRHPMKRALRLDKMALAALDAVLQLYEAPERLSTELPVLRLLARPVEEIEAQARRVLPAVQAALRPLARIDVVEVQSRIGSGSLPAAALASRALSVWPGGGTPGMDAMAIARAFRALPVPVVGRVRDGCLLLDVRCLDADEDAFVAQLGRLALEPQG